MAAPRVGRAETRVSLGSQASPPHWGLVAPARPAAGAANGARATRHTHTKHTHTRHPARRPPRGGYAPFPRLAPHPPLAPARPVRSSDIALSCCSAPMPLRFADQRAARAPARLTRASVPNLDVQGCETRHRPRLAP
jgi:hypothetical protein